VKIRWINCRTQVIKEIDGMGGGSKKPAEKLKKIKIK
jgi:hypothetical protein